MQLTEADLVAVYQDPKFIESCLKAGHASFILENYQIFKTTLISYFAQRNAVELDRLRYREDCRETLCLTILINQICKEESFTSDDSRQKDNLLASVQANIPMG